MADPLSSIEPRSSSKSKPGRLEQKTLMNVVVGGAAPLPAPPLQRDRPVLVRTDETQAGQVVAADGAELRIGRHPTSGLILDDEGISRSHARVYQAGGRYYVQDLGSSNGTYVNGVRIESCELGDGALLQIGPRVQFRFSVVDEHQERMLRQLYESSVRDSLTGAFNRHYFAERLVGEIAYANRHGTTASLLILDIDHFKKVNDTHGHPTGDAVLRSTAGIIQLVLRAEDVFARYGGEEFVVLLRDIAIAGAERAGERLRAAVARAPVVHGSATVPVSVSVGCASLACLEARTPEALVATADRRLYAAKHGGRNRVVAVG